jgi:glycosyltransferase involved in cell wall biosynthesis
LFTGAWHLPNRAAADAVRSWAASLPDDYLFVIAGSVGASRERSERLVVTGPLPSMAEWFAAADCCVNPVESGSGANVKILEYMACGLPVVTTPFGARGLAIADGVQCLVRELDDVTASLRELAADRALGASLGTAGRAFVVEERSWSAIARKRLAVVEGVRGEG